MAKKGRRHDRMHGMTAKQSQQKAPVVREGITPQLRAQVLFTLRRLRTRYREAGQKVADLTPPELLPEIQRTGVLDASQLPEEAQDALRAQRNWAQAIHNLATAIGVQADIPAGGFTAEAVEETLTMIGKFLDGQHRSTTL